MLKASSETAVSLISLLYGSGYCCNIVRSGELMFWRIVISVAVVEALLCVLPIEFAGAMALIGLFLGK
jgi:hypothetical protein